MLDTMTITFNGGEIRTENFKFVLELTKNQDMTEPFSDLDGVRSLILKPYPTRGQTFKTLKLQSNCAFFTFALLRCFK